MPHHQKHSLTKTQKDKNKQMASEKIKVEYNIAGIKSYHIVSDCLRISLIDLYDDVLGICAGFW